MHIIDNFLVISDSMNSMNSAFLAEVPGKYHSYKNHLPQMIIMNKRTS